MRNSILLLRCLVSCAHCSGLLSADIDKRALLTWTSLLWASSLQPSLGLTSFSCSRSCSPSLLSCELLLIIALYMCCESLARVHRSLEWRARVSTVTMRRPHDMLCTSIMMHTSLVLFIMDYLLSRCACTVHVQALHIVLLESLYAQVLELHLERADALRW